MTLHYIALHRIALHCFALLCIALHCFALLCIALHCFALHCIASHRITAHCIPSTCSASHWSSLSACATASRSIRPSPPSAPPSAPPPPSALRGADGTLFFSPAAPVHTCHHPRGRHVKPARVHRPSSRRPRRPRGGATSQRGRGRRPWTNRTPPSSCPRRHCRPSRRPSRCSGRQSRGRSPRRGTRSACAPAPTSNTFQQRHCVMRTRVERERERGKDDDKGKLSIGHRAAHV